MNEHMEKIQLQKRVPIDEDHLRWTPLVQGGNPSNLMKDHEFSHTEDEDQEEEAGIKNVEEPCSEEEDNCIKTRKIRKKGRKVPFKLDSEESGDEKETVAIVSNIILELSLHCFTQVMFGYRVTGLTLSSNRWESVFAQLYCNLR